MAQLNAFHAHILEACKQRDLTEPEVLRQVKAMGYDGLECGCRQSDGGTAAMVRRLRVEGRIRL